MKYISGILDALKIGTPENDFKLLIRERLADKQEALFALEQYVKAPEIWKTPLEHYLNEAVTEKDEEIIRAAQTVIQGSQAGIVGDHARVEGGIAIQHGDSIDADTGRDAFIAKDNANIFYTQNISNLSEKDRDNPEAMRKAYLHRLLCDAGVLALEGIDPVCDRDSQLSLWAVYTALLTHSTEGHERMAGIGMERETRRISALEVADRYQHVVLLGDPGSGKTTFVNFIALCLAGESLEHPEANLERLTDPVPKDEEKTENDGEEKEERQPWSHGTLVPVRVILRDFAASSLPESRTASDLWNFIENELKKAELADYAPHLKKELQEKGGLLMLDGLDEVPEADSRRVQIKAVVEDFIATFHRCRVIVTSRTYAYQKQEWRIPGLHEAVLASFTPGQIRRFIDGWYAHFAELKRVNPEDAQGKAEILKRAVFSSDRLRELAERPLLLTLTASLHSWRGGSLPEKREELYAATVDLLLDWWERPKTVRDSEGQICVIQPSLTEWLKTDRDQMRRMLNELAYNAHAKQAELTGTADIDEADLVHGLWQLSTNPDANLTQLLKYLSNRAGLILPRGVKIYSFPHRTFQEYLAACHLTDTDYPDLVAELARKEPGKWREVALLAGAKASRGSSGSIWSLAEALCYNEPEGKAETEDIWGALLAGQALAETAVMDKVSPRNKPKLERIRRWLLRIIEENLMPATERVTAGNSLSVIGDTRFNPEMFFLPYDDDLGFVMIPAGKFMMGTNEEDGKTLIKMDSFNEYWIPREKPQHKVMLSEYAIAKYPVTVTQFRAFVQDTGYEADRRWRDYPDNHPVVYVSWNDAVEYCKWLTEKLKEKGCNWKIQLPTEAQWEKAARGEDGRFYPWGNNPDPDRANYVDTGIGFTSTVGCFHKGASPYGILDMSGNVWEWCSDWFDMNYYADSPLTDPAGPQKGSGRVFRGGSWVHGAGGCRSAYRGNNSPGLRLNNLGFRLSRGLHL